MKIQPLRHSDIGQLKELQPPDWNDITPHFKYYIDSPYSNPVKIVSENKITGIGTTIKNKDSAWLAHIIVHPEYRNKGLGKKITDALVKSIDRRKYKTIYLIATKLGYPVYLKSGFELEGEYAHFNIEPGKYKSNISPNIIPFKEIHRTQILKLDQFVTGEFREIRLSKHILNSFVFFQNGKVSGVYFPTLADGMIIADSDVAGIELIKLRMMEKENAIFPKENKTAFDFYRKADFKLIQYSKRMILGKKRIRHPRNMFNRISGGLG
ncbi:MAG: GNAT family N-acetyltransferase [Ignavibacteriae bacterium]|nr:GNAT family N-acetyltransferase [Ignavibacteriota bacterium]